MQERVKTSASNAFAWSTARLDVYTPEVLADLVLCAPVVADEARTQGIDLQAHYAHLLVHGTLHAQGWDHDDDAQAAAMEAQESRILKALGWPDPYAVG